MLENDSEIAGRTDGIFPMCFSDCSDGRKADVDHYSSSSYYISCFAQKEKKKENQWQDLGKGTYSNKSHVTKLRLVGSLKLLREGDFLW